jgi:hypothetical protein
MISNAFFRKKLSIKMNEFTSNDHIFKLEINNSTNRSAAELYNLLLSGNGNGGTLTTTVDHGNGQMPLTKTNLTEEVGSGF